jgi:hypothetical protein
MKECVNICQFYFLSKQWINCLHLYGTLCIWFLMMHSLVGRYLEWQFLFRGKYFCTTNQLLLISRPQFRDEKINKISEFVSPKSRPFLFSVLPANQHFLSILETNGLNNRNRKVCHFSGVVCPRWYFVFAFFCKIRSCVSLLDTRAIMFESKPNQYSHKIVFVSTTFCCITLLDTNVSKHKISIFLTRLSLADYIFWIYSISTTRN